MKNFVRVLALVLAFVMMFACLTACGNDKKKIVGTWEGTVEGISFEMKFEKSGDFEMTVLGMTAMEGEWDIKGSKLILKTDDDTEKCKYELKGKKLTLKDFDGEEIVLTKK